MGILIQSIRYESRDRVSHIIQEDKVQGRTQDNRDKVLDSKTNNFMRVQPYPKPRPCHGRVL